ncbi:MAG: hypothetical protein ACTH31_16220, partial [Pseudoclavibacter sp.]
MTDVDVTSADQANAHPEPLDAMRERALHGDRVRDYLARAASERGIARREVAIALAGEATDPTARAELITALTPLAHDSTWGDDWPATALDVLLDDRVAPWLRAAIAHVAEGDARWILGEEVVAGDRGLDAGADPDAGADSDADADDGAGAVRSHAESQKLHDRWPAAARAARAAAPEQGWPGLGVEPTREFARLQARIALPSAAELDWHRAAIHDPSVGEPLL